MDALDDEEYTGGLVELLQEGINFVKRNSKKAWKKLPDRRVEYPEYPERAVTEGLVNALIHRSYTELGSEVHIDIFDDRLEIYSPGGMIDGSSLVDKDLMIIPSKRRSPILADVFSRLTYMERQGSGFKKIIGDYKAQENYTDQLHPVFEAHGGYFILTLFNLNYVEGHNAVQDVPKDELDQQIIELIKENAKITTEQMSERLGVSIKTIKRHINKFPNVSYVGSGYSGHWEIV